MLSSKAATSGRPKPRRVPQDLCHPFFDGAPREAEPSTSYVICSTPRSGSTLLSHFLAGTGQHGVPHEYLNQHSCMRVLARRYGLLEPGGALPVSDQGWIAEYLKTLISRRTAPNGIFGIKMHFDQFAPFVESPAVSGFVKRSRCILMVREDLLGQAASFERAVQTRAWRSALREQKPATFDRAAIERRMKELKGQVTRWTNYLQANQLPFVQVSYEELCANSSGVLASVCSFLGVPLSPEKAEHVVESVPLMVQRDATSEQWRQQFLAGSP